MDRFDFYGIKFSATNMDNVLGYISSYDLSDPAYISFPDSSVVAMANKDDYLKLILNNALLTLPDGKPSQIAARKQGFSHVSTVSGYWLCKTLLSDSQFTHYFLGSTDEKLQLIQNQIKADFPSARVLGYRSPAFLSADEFRNGHLLAEEMEEINRLSPDFIWVGLSSPKQDFLLKSHVDKLNRGILLGVGGVFDYLSGDVVKSPEWIKKVGLRWLWRLAREPRRLGPKYWNTIKFFIGNAYKKN